MKKELSCKVTDKYTWNLMTEVGELPISLSMIRKLMHLEKGDRVKMTIERLEKG